MADLFATVLRPIAEQRGLLEWRFARWLKRRLEARRSMVRVLEAMNELPGSLD